jgi:hypothetical protein
MWQEPLLHFKLTNSKVCVLEKIGGSEHAYARIQHELRP